MDKKLLLQIVASTTLFFSGVTYAQTASFTDSYRNGSSCGTNYSIKGVEPSATGTYPVFIYTVGTSESYDNAAAMAAVQSMAAKGYVAATIAYPNSTFGGCSSFNSKASCAFDPAKAASAVSKICARGKADCSKGIIVAGFSQGAILALLARKYDSRVEAAYGMGLGTNYSGTDVSSCTKYGNYTLSADRLRVINGEADGFLGGNANAVRTQTEDVTGLKGATDAYSAYRSNSSGWQMVKHTEMADGSADHCYMRTGGSGCSASQNTLDEGWKSGTGEWALEQNLKWLTKFTRP